MAAAKPIDVQSLRAQASVCAERGLLIRPDGSPFPVRVGAKGYALVTLGGVTKAAHRLIWALANDASPDGQVDHIDGNKLNNRPANLRCVSGHVNQQNRRGENRNNILGLMGVSPNRCSTVRPFTAHITIAGKSKYLGSFKTAEDAHQSYLAAKRAHHAGCTI
jgi:hypothetical protein